MVLFAVVLAGWLALTFPAAVLMGKCIERGLRPGGEPDLSETSAIVPAQRPAPQDAGAQDTGVPDAAVKDAAVQGSASAARTQV